MSDQEDGEIWSEFFRIKNRLMDYDENLRESISNIHMLMKIGQSQRLGVHYAKAQKHVGLVLDLGIAAGAIPDNAHKEELERVIAISRGNWKDIKDFDYAQEVFRKWYQQTKFYKISIDKDNRPAVIKKYGKARFA